MTRAALWALLERERMLLDTIVNASPTGILLLNARTWTCELVNPALQTLAGPALRPGATLADGWRDALPGLMPLLAESLTSDTVVKGDLEVQVPSNGTGPAKALHLMVSTMHIEPEADQSIVLVFVTDVTERVELHGQLLQAQKMEAIGRLAGGIAHDFNNLLTPILGYTDLVMNSMSDDDGRRRDLEEVRHAATSATALTRQLLTFSRKQLIDPTIVDLNAVLREVERLLTRALGEDVELVQQHDTGLDPIRADRNQIEQIIMNVSVNARDAMPHGGALTITTRNQTLTLPATGERQQIPPGRYVILSIADTGTGITPDVLTHMFEPFYTTKEFGKGTGLGLSTVYGIVRDSGGYVSVSSAEGEGTTFAFLFPVADGKADRTPGPLVPASTEHMVELPRGSETILLVEDNDSLRRLAERVLTPLGYNVLTARNAEDALDVNARTSKPIDILLTDIVLPGADGITLSRRLRVPRPALNVLFMSGYSGPELSSRDPRTVGVKLLHKPFAPSTLARAVRDTLDRATGDRVHGVAPIAGHPNEVGRTR
jgi:two-component system cell cycle sensor histidine kinase/response regulator CckA